MIKVMACITTRDSRPDFHVFTRLRLAAEYSYTSSGTSVEIAIAADPYSVALCRNRAVMRFLTNPENTHLFFVDNDVHIQRDALDLLLSLDASVAVGCYPSIKGAPEERYRLFPYLLVQREGGWLATWFDGPLEVEKAGTGCMLIKREVLEALGYPWFRWVERPNFDAREIRSTSDDMDFSERARDANFRIIAHGNVRCSHFKEFDVANLIYEDRVLDVVWLGPQTLEQQENSDAISCGGEGSPSETLRQMGPQKDSPDGSEGQKARSGPQYQRKTQLERAFKP